MDPVARIAQIFAENLVRARNRADLSQEDLGVGASVHRTEISQLERGLRVPRIDTLVKLAGGLATSPCELLAGMEWTPGHSQVGHFRLSEGQEATSQKEQKRKQP